MTRGQRRKTAVRIRIELDENQVPDFHAQRTPGIDQCPARVACRGQVHMQFRTRAARTGLSHHPEIVLLVAVDDVHLRVQPGRAELLRPETPRLFVAFGRIAGGRIVNRGVEPLRREFPSPDDQLPCPFDRFFFEIVAERPVPEHLEKGVVVGIEPHILEVVVLAAGTDALLGVRRPRVASRQSASPFRNIGRLLP